MSDTNSSNNSVGIVAILATLVLVGFAAWFFLGRPGNARVAAPTSQAKSADINVKVNLPDTVTIGK